MASGAKFARAGLIAAISLVVGLSTFGSLLKQPGPRQASAARIVISVPPGESARPILTEPTLAEPLGVPPANVAVRARAPAADEPVGSIAATPKAAATMQVGPATQTAPAAAPAALVSQPAAPAAAPAASASLPEAPAFPPMQTHEGAEAIATASSPAEPGAENEKPAAKKKSKRADSHRRKAVRPAPYEIREFFAGRW